MARVVGNGLKIPSGATSGYVFTSDGSGNGSWAASSGGGGGTGTPPYITTIGDGTATTFTVTHGLNSRDVLVEIRETNSPYERMLVKTTTPTVNTVFFDFTGSVIPATNEFTVIVSKADGGTNVQVALNVSNFGAGGGGVIDDRAAIQSAIDALAGNGILDFMPGKTYLLNSGGALKVPMGATKVHLRLNGATLLLSSSCPTAFRQDRTADYQTCQNFTLEGGNIDANSIGGQYTASIFGSAVDTYNQRVHFDKLTFRQLRSFNLPTGTSPQPTANPWRGHIFFNVTEPSTGMGPTQVNVTNILCEDIDMQGGLFGINAVGQNGTGGTGDKNIYFDNITLRRCKHDTLTSFQNLPQVYGSNYQFGSLGFGGRLVLEDVEGYRSGDVGLEINCFENVRGHRVTMQDGSQVNFLFRNYNTVWTGTAANIDKQRYNFRSSYSRYDTLVPTAAQSNNPLEGFYLGSGELGQIDLIDCGHYVRQLDSVGTRCRAILGAARTLNTQRFRAHYATVNANPGANGTPGFPFALGGFASGNAAITMEDTSVKISGTATGSFSWAPRLISLATGIVWLEVNGFMVDASVTGAPGGTAVGIYATSGMTLNGTIRGVVYRTLNLAASNLGYDFEQTTTDRLDINESDNTGITAGGSGGDWFVGAPSTAWPFITFNQFRRISYPRADTFITVTASPFTYSNGTNMDQQVLIQGGTISSIEFCSTQAGTFRFLNPATGAVAVGNGERLRITYTVAPTMYANYPR